MVQLLFSLFIYVYMSRWFSLLKSSARITVIVFLTLDISELYFLYFHLNPFWNDGTSTRMRSCWMNTSPWFLGKQHRGEAGGMLQCRTGCLWKPCLWTPWHTHTVSTQCVLTAYLAYLAFSPREVFQVFIV